MMFRDCHVHYVALGLPLCDTPFLEATSCSELEGVMSAEHVTTEPLDDGEDAAPDASPIKRLLKNLDTTAPEDEGNSERPAGRPSLVRDAKVYQNSVSAIREVLDQGIRETTAAVQLVEWSQHHLRSAEARRDDAYRAFADVVPLVERTGRDLKAAMEGSKDGKSPENIEAQFEKSAAALEQLAKATESLNSQLVWCRASWKQFNDSVAAARRMRAKFSSNGNGNGNGS